MQIPFSRIDDWLRGHGADDAADLVATLAARIEREERLSRQAVPLPAIDEDEAG